MNAEETRRAAQVMLAAAEGKKVQRRRLPNGTAWQDCLPLHAWDWFSFDYRVKPEPLEGWVNVYPDTAGRYISFHSTKENADRSASDARIRCVKMREVEE